MFRSLVLAAAVALSACAPTLSAPTSPGQVAVDPVAPIATPTPIPSTSSSIATAAARAKVALDRAWTAYVAIRGVADLVEPLLSPTRRANLQVLETTIESYFLKARLASTLADQAFQLDLAVRAAGQLDAIVSDPD